VRAEILRLLFATPTKRRYVRELVGMSGLALCTVQDELRKLSAIGLVTSWSNGYQRFYSANRAHPLYSELLRFVQLSERLPPTRLSALHRQRRSRLQRKQKRRKVITPSNDFPGKWGLFSRTRRNLTA
jgi:predicted transcriptional regulator